MRAGRCLVLRRAPRLAAGGCFALSLAAGRHGGLQIGVGSQTARGTAAFVRGRQSVVSGRRAWRAWRAPPRPILYGRQLRHSGMYAWSALLKGRLGRSAGGAPFLKKQEAPIQP